MMLKRMIDKWRGARQQVTNTVPSTPREIAELRRAEFLAGFDLRNAKGLEIGPFCKPVFRRDSHPGILYADVMTEDYLRRLARKGKKYREEDVVPLDHVLADRRLDEVIAPGTLDFVFCAHVLEHVPDLIATLQGIERVLRPGGLFLCFFPDRRYTYNIDRPATTLAQLQDRHRRRIRKPDPAIVEEHFLLNRAVDVGALWQGKGKGIGARRYTPEKARANAADAESFYVDVHCNVLSDTEFADVIAALGRSGHCGLHLKELRHTRAPLHEFHVALMRPPAPDAV